MIKFDSSRTKCKTEILQKGLKIRWTVIRWDEPVFKDLGLIHSLDVISVYWLIIKSIRFIVPHNLLIRNGIL